MLVGNNSSILHTFSQPGQCISAVLILSHFLFHFSCLATQQNKNRAGTCRPAVNFSSEDDAKGLRKAMKGLGCDKNAVLNIIAYRSTAQVKEAETLTPLSRDQARRAQFADFAFFPLLLCFSFNRSAKRSS